MTACLSFQKKESLTSLLQRVKFHNPATALTFMRLLETMSTAHAFIPLSFEEASEMVRLSASRPLSPLVSNKYRCPIGGGRPESLGKPTEPLGKGSPGKSDVTHFCVHGCWVAMCLPQKLGGTCPPSMAPSSDPANSTASGAGSGGTTQSGPDRPRTHMRCFFWCFNN